MPSKQLSKPRRRKVVDDTPLHPWIKENLIEWPVDATPEQLDKILAPDWRKTFGEMLALLRQRAIERAMKEQNGAADTPPNPEPPQ